MAKPELRHHRKFVKLRRLLQERESHCRGYLDCMWEHGYQTGDPLLGDAIDVATAADHPDESDRFANAALEAGFLEINSSGQFVIHDLYDHAPDYVKKRMKRKGTAPNGGQTAGDGDQLAPEPGQTAKVGAHSQEERAKSQEERTDSQEPKSESQEQAAKPEAGGERCKISFDPASGEWRGITDRQRGLWAKAYPAVDLDADLAKATVWCLANPTKAPKSNYARFLSNWFSRTQDRGGNRGRDSPRPTTDLGSQIASNGTEFLRRTGTVK